MDDKRSTQALLRKEKKAANDSTITTAIGAFLQQYNRNDLHEVQ